MVNFIDFFHQNSIRINDQKLIYIDPFLMRDEPKNADIIFITHDHHDHFSPDDIKKVMKNNTTFVIPKSLSEAIKEVINEDNKVIEVEPYQSLDIEGYHVETIPSYNLNKKFHPRENNWVGYIITINNQRIYIAGDTDAIEEGKKVECDIAMIPIGGTYTMDSKEAAEFINIMKPKIVIPVHYGGNTSDEKEAQVFLERVNSDIQVSIQKIYD